MRFITSILVLLGAATTTRSQVLPSTEARDFWFGFLETVPSSGNLLVDVGSSVTTNATLSIPASGLSWSFVVNAGSPTTYFLSYAQAMPTGSEVTMPMGLHVVADDPVSVTVLNTLTVPGYSADATAIMPTEALGTDYRVLSYRGVTAAGYMSALSIVPTSDSTEVEITPSVPTLGGRPANVPFTVMLNAGDLYPVKAATGTDDLTGTKIRVVAGGGACKPIAVFAGAVCANVPVGCMACDHLVEQMWPSRLWGSTYHMVPFTGTTAYTYRILAVEDSTAITVNNNAPFHLNAGEWRDSVNVASAICVSGDRPFLAAQFMQGFQCVGAGDPSLIHLTPADRKVQRIEFRPWSIGTIGNHQVNIIVDSANIGDLTLDGVPIAAGDFSPFSACPGSVHTSRPISVANHVIACSGGFTAYAFGFGQANSYAYAMNTSGVFGEAGEEVICADAGATITLHAPLGIQDPYWVDTASPDDTLAIGPTIIVPATGPVTYAVLTGDSGSCGSYQYQIALNPPATITDSLGVLTGPSGHSYQWYLSGSPIPGATARTYVPVVNGTYHLEVTSSSGCTSVSADHLVLSVAVAAQLPAGLGIHAEGQHVRIDDPTFGVEEVQLYSSIGQLLEVRGMVRGQGPIHVPVKETGVHVLRLLYHGNWIALRQLVME